MFPALTVLPLLAGDAGTAQTVDAMRRFVDQFQDHPWTRAAVVQALDGVPEKDTGAELSALLEWVRSRVRFTRDPVLTEYLQSPVRLLGTIREGRLAVGDCDDMATLYATLAEGAGYPTRFLTQGAAGADFSHVLVEVDAGGRWVPVDPSQRTAGIDWRPRAGVGRERREMHLGQDILLGPYEAPPDIMAEALAYEAPFEYTAEAAAPSFSFGEFFSGLTETARAALPILERYGIAKPITGYTPTGQPLYGAPLPVGGVPGIAYQRLTEVGPLGLSMGTWLLIGAGGLVVLLLARK